MGVFGTGNSGANKGSSRGPSPTADKPPKVGKTPKPTANDRKTMNQRKKEGQ